MGFPNEFIWVRNYLKTNASINSYFQSSIPSMIQYKYEFLKTNFIKSPVVLWILWQFNWTFNYEQEL